MERADVKKLGELARISLSDAEIDKFLGNFTSILDFVSQIGEISSKGKSAPSVGGHHNIMREDADAHEPSQYTEAILDSAPAREGDYLKVKKIL